MHAMEYTTPRPQSAPLQRTQTTASAAVPASAPSPSVSHLCSRGPAPDPASRLQVTWQDREPSPPCAPYRAATLAALLSVMAVGLRMPIAKMVEAERRDEVGVGRVAVEVDARRLKAHDENIGERPAAVRLL